MPQLGVNIDHIATLRNARGGQFPDPIQAAMIAEEYGADGITAHLREDRRHMKDTDMQRLRALVQTRLNMEMANTPEMVSIALTLKPDMVTLVPERRQELTTEGGLDVLGNQEALKTSIRQLQDNGIQVSLFIDARAEQVAASHAVSATLVEFHTGPYCAEFFQTGGQPVHELKCLYQAAEQAHQLSLIVNAGHGLDYQNLPPLLNLPGLYEFNIGHSIIAEAVFSGLGPAVHRMKELIQS